MGRGHGRVVVYFHGGGFVIGSPGSAAYHRCLNDLAAACPAIAVSIDSRLTPKHPVPAAYEDSLAALQWALSWPGTARAATSATTSLCTGTSGAWG
ncbi:hypothetical protein BAE44_0014680 [Dichanthelium oligosanthes]|uniref:Alpha/beta hydrolase fold-3 domain-containing protein n=1 Tax=Dichanthelium oligosanthes TaxID=888268 RepID=A0A1E5VGS1_9POAL|nr:hypothetical protein BAE44_0014680 [Dichanthelium oligosanthes]